MVWIRVRIRVKYNNTRIFIQQVFTPTLFGLALGHQSSDLLLRSGCSEEQCERRADGTPTCLFSPLLLFPLPLPQPGPGLNLEGNPPWDERMEEEAGLA